MRTQGYWASRSSNKQIGRGGFPSNYYLAWLALLDDGRGRQEVTPFYFISEDLCNLSPLISLAAQIPASLHGFGANRHRYHYAAAIMNRFGHWIVTCYLHNFNRTFISALDQYIAKIVYLQATPSTAALELLQSFSLEPIIIAETHETHDLCLKAGLRAQMMRNLEPKQLLAQIGDLFSTPIDRLKALQFADESLLPARFVADHPDAYVFCESELPPQPSTGLRFLEPNETLINVMRGRANPARLPDTPPRDKSVDMVIASADETFATSLAEYLLAQEQINPDPELDPALRERITAFNSSKSVADYADLVASAAQHLPEYPGAQGWIFCVPAIHRESIEASLGPKVPDRILKNVLRRKGGDYLTWVEPRDLKSEKDSLLLLALMQYASLENAYMSAVLTLYALAARSPVVRTPQMSSGLFGRLREVHQAHQDGSALGVNKQIAKFSMQFLQELPPQISLFLGSHRGPHLKVISDLPVEWLLLDGVPLMMQRDMSRIPIRPGNGLLIHFDECRETLRLGWAELSKVLIMDCTCEGDEVGDYSYVLHEALLGIGFNSEHFRPSTVEDYGDRLRTAEPYILVHWGHGSYDTEGDRGYLHLGDKKVEVWDWVGMAVPPIVLLAACETSALAQTHNNPANAWLALGARSVLATLLPVDALLTCILFTRIFANLFESLRGEQVLPDWSTVVSKTLMLQRYLDFHYEYQKWRTQKGMEPIPHEFFLEYTYRWNKSATSLADGYRRCTEIVREALAHFGEEFAISFDRYLKSHAVLPHTMFFTHLGSPETIKLVKVRADSDPESESRRYWRERDGIADASDPG